MTDLSKQLKEQFEGGNTSDTGRQSGDPSAHASRTASGVALTQHDLVNTANVALVSTRGRMGGGAPGR